MAKREVKIAVLGEGAVGKSTSTIQLCQGIFIEEYDPTIEDSYRKLVVYDGEEIILDVLDTAGCEEFSAMREAYIKTGQGFILMYAITGRGSFEQVQFFVDQIRRTKDIATVKGCVVLVGNKCDLEDRREVSFEDGQTLAKKLGVPFFETSAKTAHNIEQAFGALTGEILKNLPEPEASGQNGRHCLVQ